MRDLSVWLVAILACTSAEKTCWKDNKCVEVFATKFFQESTSSDFSNGNAEFAFQYMNGSPAVDLSNDPLPRIQLIGDYSGAGNDDFVVVLAVSNDGFNYVADVQASKSIMDDDGFIMKHGLRITNHYPFDKSTGIFNLSDIILPVAVTSQTRHIGLCKTVKVDNKDQQDCKFVSSEANILIFTPGGLTTFQQYSILVFLLCFSGLFSGLNLGLMALDPRQLEALKNVPSKQKDATIVYPVRKTGNFLLCVLLLGNTLVNTTLSVLTGDLFSGIYAVIGSTFGIVIFGEIIPQSLCSRYGLKIGAKTIWLTKIFMFVTAPIAWPISKLLDCVLGEEIGAQLVREELVALINVGGGDGLEDDERKAVKGALELSQRIVSECFSKLRNVFMISDKAVLDYKTIAQIMSTGYTRIPIYEDQRTNIVGLLLIRDLAFVDPDDCTTLKMLMQENHREIFWVHKSMKLDKCMEKFLEHKSHIAAVFDDTVSTNDLSKETRFVNDHEAVGIITLEDVMEQLLGEQIFDECDREPMHNRPKKDSLVDNPEPGLVRVQTGVNIVGTKHLLAASRYLVNNVSAFSSFDAQGDTLLKYIRMNNDKAYNVITCEDLEENPKLSILMSPDEVSNYFILILEGFCTIRDKQGEVNQSKGPFDFFGHKSLTLVSSLFPALKPATGANVTFAPSVQAKKDSSHDYIANYEVSVKETEKFKDGKEKFVYIKITQDVYMQALREEMMRQNRKTTVVGALMETAILTETARKRNVSEGVKHNLSAADKDLV